MAEGEVALDISEKAEKPPPPHEDEKPTSSNGDENATTKPNDAPPSKKGCLDYAGNILLYTLFGIFLIFFVPLYLLYMGLAWLFCNIDVTEDKPGHHSTEPKGGNKTIFQKVKDLQEKAKNWGEIPYVIRSRLVIFMLSWLIVNLTVPVLRNKLVLGTKLWKWSLLVTMIVCGYHLINMLNKFLIHIMCTTMWFKKKQNWVYYVRGMRQSVNLVAHAALILLTWVSYFRTSHGIKKTDDTKTLLHVCTWSFVTFAVMAVLWLLKSVLLLKWKADAVYRRFSQRILVAGEQLYFLGYICGWRLGVFKPTSEEEKEKIKLEGVDNQDQNLDGGAGAQPEKDGDTVKDGENREKEKKKVKEILLRGKDNVNLYNIQKMTEYFVDLFNVSSRDDDGTSEIVNQCAKIYKDIAPEKDIGVDELVKCFELEKEDAKILYSSLKRTLNSQNISSRNFEKSMVRAQSNCVALGHTLSDAREVVEVLDNVMICLLFVIVFIAWLLLTDIATTKILALIASPILAVVFIFGGTAKNIFEGIIFSFINHPFDVGDRCIIDKIEVEVRRMSVLTTTFVGVGTKEDILYPNSALAAIPIVNLKGEPDSSDCVEITLDSNHTKSMLDKLLSDIDNLFEKDGGKRFEKSNLIVVKQIGDCVKMEVQFDHVMSINEMTHSQCLKKKQQQKSLLLLQIKQLIEEINAKNKGTIVEISQ